MGQDAKLGHQFFSLFASLFQALEFVDRFVLPIYFFKILLDGSEEVIPGSKVEGSVGGMALDKCCLPGGGVPFEERQGETDFLRTVVVDGIIDCEIDFQRIEEIGELGSVSSEGFWEVYSEFFC